MDYFTLGYTVSQILVFFLVLGILWKIKGWLTHTNTAASILTVFGVLGTFIGIYIGLQGFGTENLQSSIKELLGGLKLAFRTSIVGIASALLLKGIISPIAQKYQTRKDPDPIDAAIDKIVLALKDVETSGESNLSSKLEVLIKAIKNKDSDTGTVLGGIYEIKTALTGEAERAIPTQLQSLSKALSESRLNTIEASLSDEEGNLLTELRFLRKEMSTKHDELRDEFQQFAKNVAESVAKLATDELIEALKKVIEDFNTKIQEQFGENFKQLNEAVGRTVEWQEQYRQQMDELADEFRIATQSIEKSRAALASAAQSLMTIEDQSESLVSVAEKLDPILHTLNDQLEAFSELRQKAHDAFPLIEDRLDDLTMDFSEAVKTAITDSHTSMESQRDALKETNQLVTELTTNFSDTVKVSIAESQASMNRQWEALTNQVDQLQTTMGACNQQVQRTIDEIRDRLDTVFERSADHISQITTSFTQSLTQQLQDLLKGQAHELGNIVERNREDIENHVNALHSSLRKEVNTMNESLRKELDDSLRTLAGYLESLSNGFVGNYERVADIYTQVLIPIQQLVETTRQGRG